jgi:hypothetical protein
MSSCSELCLAARSAMPLIWVDQANSMQHCQELRKFSVSLLIIQCRCQPPAVEGIVAAVVSIMCKCTLP